MLKRHSPYKKLYHPTPNLHLNNFNNLWKLPPYEIANFSGQLFKVMQTAIEEYLCQECLASAQENFEKTAFPHHPH